MDESSHKPGLYRWKKQTDTRLYSRSQKVTTKNDIQDWIKTVESASDKAAQKVFGSNPKSGKALGKVATLKSVSQLREHDAALSEAQDLLSQWMDEKVNLQDDGDDYLDDDMYQRRMVQSDVKREWDHLLQDNYEEQGLVKPQPTINDTDPYAFLAEQDEESAVESILKHMLSKKVVNDNFTNDLGFDDLNKPDPRTKMELRHQQVKENREKRQKVLDSKKKEQRAKKDAHHKAKQIILQEEKNKQADVKKEEMKIRKEMARIRKDMQEERRQLDEQKSRQRKNQEETLHKATVLVDTEEARSLQERGERERAEEDRRRKIMVKLGQIQTRQEAANLKSLHRHFSAWYNIVLQRRLQIGRAKAIHDWKLLLQAWNAWKAYIRTRRIDWETKQHEITIIQTHRKTHAAETHYRVWLLRKYFVAWQLWIKMEQERNEMEQAQEKTRNKMAALLEAAAKGKLSEGNNTDRSEQGKGKVVAKATNLEVDALFESNQRRPLTSRSDVSTVVDSNSERKPVQRNRIPTEAWQITKRHLQLTTDEIAGLGGGDNQGEHHSDQKIRNRFGTQPWMNRKYTPNSFQNRHQAQQQILEEQQRQLKEQQKLIQELQFNQNQQMLEQQGNTQKQLAERITPENPLQMTNKSKTTVNKRQQHARLNNGEISDRHLDSRAGVTDRNAFGPLTERSEVTEPSDVTERSEVTARSEVTSASNAAAKKNDTKYLAVLKNMEDRAAERSRLKAEREEKRRLEEEENLKRLKAEEDMLLQRDAEEKRARVAAHREKKRLEKERETQKQQREQHMKELTKKADAHYLRATLKYRCLGPFKKLVEMARRNKVMAVRHHNNNLQRLALQCWRSNVKDIVSQKEATADQMYNYFLVRHFFSNWRNFKHHTTIMEGRARRIHQRNTKCKVLRVWYEYAQEERGRGVANQQLADDHYRRSLLKKTFKTIKDYPLERKRAIAREKRRADMREKVAALIPDYEAIEIRKSSTDFS
ncbi:coiled-coil domain-containing protein 191-like [Mizuhopecten yessoensis]|uniref:coiled-coil domain-containing protein 191-like n=1 Tax=Mizuhopecten yessoensis TaxID=6573 RepID=UPI000B459C35|nr:coiled-coil domain-containing protein 191-like [Mizuhopecten yessoensis]